MSRFLVVTEGIEPASAEPVFATGSPTLVAAAIRGMFGELSRIERQGLAPSQADAVGDVGGSASVADRVRSNEARP